MPALGSPPDCIPGATCHSQTQSPAGPTERGIVAIHRSHRTQPLLLGKEVRFLFNVVGQNVPLL